MSIKWVIFILFAAVLTSLFAGLYFLLKDRGQSQRTVNALFFRVGFSALLLLLVLYGLYSGQIP
jgi:hypothetical protein